MAFKNDGQEVTDPGAVDVPLTGRQLHIMRWCLSSYVPQEDEVQEVSELRDHLYIYERKTR